MNREGLVSEDEDEEDQAEEAAAVAMTPDSDETIPTPAVETKSDPQADAADDNM
jgi:hypothetical protein